MPLQNIFLTSFNICLGRSRLKLESPNPDGRTAGFVTLNCWTFDNTKFAGSTDSTPLHSASHKVKYRKTNYVLSNTDDTL